MFYFRLPWNSHSLTQQTDYTALTQQSDQLLAKAGVTKFTKIS